MLTRRRFINQLQQYSVLAVLPWPTTFFIRDRETPTDMTIDSIEIVRLQGIYQRQVGVNRQYQSQPIHIYPEYRPAPYTDDEHIQFGSHVIRHDYLRIRTKGGLEGFYGYLDPETISPILGQLRSFLLGKHALQIERLWDLMY